MLFENLKTSLELNSDAAPTVELAFRLANVLFKDIAREAGVADIDTCPTGDTLKFLKVLKRQCYVTETVCAGNLENYSQYRAELEGYLSEITAMRKRCEEIEAMSEGTDDVTHEIERLNARLSEAQRRKDEYNALLNQKSELEREISAFGEDDPAPILDEIEALRKKHADLISERELNEKKKSELIAENERLAGEKNKLISEISDLISASDTLSKAIEIRQSDTERMTEEKIAAQKRLRCVEEALDSAVNEYKELRSRYDSLSGVEIPKSERLISEIKERVSVKESELDTAKKEYVALLQKNTDTKNELDRVNAEKSDLENELFDLNKSINDTNADIARLEREISDITASGEENMKKLADAAERLKYLEERRNRLLRSIEKTAEYLGVESTLGTNRNYVNLLKANTEKIIECTNETVKCLREAREAIL